MERVPALYRGLPVHCCWTRLNVCKFSVLDAFDVFIDDRLTDMLRTSLSNCSMSLKPSWKCVFPEYRHKLSTNIAALNAKRVKYFWSLCYEIEKNHISFLN